MRFFAAGSYQMDVGEYRHASVSQPSVSRIIEEVTNAFCNPAISDQFVYFSNNFNELDGVRTMYKLKYFVNYLQNEKIGTFCKHLYNIVPQYHKCLVIRSIIMLCYLLLIFIIYQLNPYFTLIFK